MMNTILKLMLHLFNRYLSNSRSVQDAFMVQSFLSLGNLYFKKENTS